MEKGKRERIVSNILLAVLLIIGIIVRIYHWPNGLNAVNCDEAMSAINAKAIADYGKDIYGTSYPVYFEAWQEGGQSAFLIYTMALCIKIFGFSIFSVRLPMLLISILALIITYDFAKRIFKDKKIALVILAFLVINPWQIMQARWSLDCNMFPHLTLISIYLLYLGITKKKWMIYLSMIFFGFTMYTYGVAIYFIPVLLLILGIYFVIKKRITGKELALCIVIYLLISFPIYLMGIINIFHLETIHLGPFTIQYFDKSVRTSDMFLFSENKLETLTANIQSLFTVLVKQKDGLPANYVPGFGTTYPISILFFIFGFLSLWLLKEEKVEKGLEKIEEETKKEKDLSNERIGKNILMLWLFLSFILGILINNTNINRLNIIWYPIIFITGYGIYEFYYLLRKKRTKIILGSFLILFFSISFTLFEIRYFTKHTQIIENSKLWSNGLIQAIWSVKEEAEVIHITDDLYGKGIETYIKFASDFDLSYYLEEKKENNLSFWEKYKVEKIQKYDNPEDAYIIKKKELNSANLKLEEYDYQEFQNYIVLRKKL